MATSVLFDKIYFILLPGKLHLSNETKERFSNPTDSSRFWNSNHCSRQQRKAKLMDVQRGTSSSSTRGSKRKFGPFEGTIHTYTAQCDKCLKWRKIESYEMYELIRSRVLVEPYVCEEKGMSCDDATDLTYNDSSETWAVDKPGLPKSPTGFKRTLIPRKNNTKVDAYYMTPCKKRLRSRNEVAAFIEINQAYKDVPLTDFDFQVPKVIYDIVVKSSKENDSTESSKKNE